MATLPKTVSDVKPKAPPDPLWLEAEKTAYKLKSEHDEALKDTRESVWSHLGDRCNGSFCRPLYAGEYGIAKLGADTPAIIVGTIRTEKDADGDEIATLTVYVVACSPEVQLLVAVDGDHLADLLLQMIAEGKWTPAYRDKFDAQQGIGIISTIGFKWSAKAVFDMLAPSKSTSEGAKP